MRKYTDEQVTRLLADYFDPERVVLICSKHGYIPGSSAAPTPRCEECSHIFIQNLTAKQPPHMREAFLERLAELVHKLVENEAELAGVNLYSRPKFEIEKGS
jgi:hypothetical protein